MKIKTSKRLYYVKSIRNVDGMWNAYFQPLNPKTGVPWQAVRSIVEGHDCYSLGKYGQTPNALVMGTPPAFEVWCRQQGYDYCFSGFSTPELAEAACRAHMAKSKLQEVEPAPLLAPNYHGFAHYPGAIPRWEDPK